MASGRQMKMLSEQDEEIDSYEAGSGSDEDSENAFQIEVVETIYFDVVITCARSSHWIRISGSVFFLIVGIAFQVLLSTVLVPAIAQDQVTSKTQIRVNKTNSDWNLFDDWRHDAKDGAEVNWNKTWAEWACIGEDWSWQANVMDDYAGYTKQFKLVNHALFHVSNGRLFGIVAITLWVALIVREFNSIFEYALLVFLPASPVGTCYRRTADGASASLAAVPNCVKVLVVIVVILRLVININLGLNGVKFLAHTESLKDFILNSVALGFIFDIDELVFAVFVSKSKKRYLRAIGTVEAATPGCVSQILDLYWEFISLVLLLIMLILAYVFYLNDFATTLREKAYCQMCTGFAGADQCNL